MVSILALLLVEGGVAGVVSMGAGLLAGWFVGVLSVVVAGGSGKLGISSVIGFGAFFEDTLDFLEAKIPFPLLLPAEFIELRSGLEALLLARGVNASRNLRPFDEPVVALPEFGSNGPIVLARLDESEFIKDPVLEALKLSARVSDLEIAREEEDGFV